MDDGDQFPAKRILDDDTKKKRYKVDWEGVNPDTGRAWSPTWEPYEYVSDILVKEWNSKKKKRSDVGFQKASRAALRDFDIRRNRTETPSEEEYVSPEEAEDNDWATRYALEADTSKSSKAKDTKKRKNMASGSGSSYKPSTQSSRSTQASTELSTLISPGSLQALQSQKGKTRQSSGPTSTTTRNSKRRRKDDSIASPRESRTSPKRLRRQEETKLSSSDSEDIPVVARQYRQSSSDEEDVPVVSSRSMQFSDGTRAAQPSPPKPAPIVPQLKAIPESLRLRTTSTSMSTITHGPSAATSNDLFSETSLVSNPDALPPCARDLNHSDDEPRKPGASKTARRAHSARAGKGKAQSQSMSRRRSDDVPSRLAESSLPSFRKAANGTTSTADDPFHSHQRKPSAHSMESKEDWALLDASSKEAHSHDTSSNGSLSVIPDSAPQHNHTLSPTASPRRDGQVTISDRNVVRESWRTGRSSGSRLALANTEKPRMPIKVPDPAVFKSVLTSTQATEDIHQFSSQAEPPLGESSSDEVLRDLITSGQPVVERAFPSRNRDIASAAPIDLLEASESNHSQREATHGRESFEYPGTLAAEGGILDQTTVDAKKEQARAQTEELTGLATEQRDIESFEQNLQNSASPVQPAFQPQPPARDLPEADTGPLDPVVTTDAHDETRSPPVEGGARILGPPQTVETVKTLRTATALIRKSTLLNSEDTRQDLIFFVEDTGYYVHQQRALTKQPSWDFELEQTVDLEQQTSWHLILDTTAPDWKLEKRSRLYVTVAGDSGNEHIMSLYNDLLTAHVGMKKESDAMILRSGQLEADVAFLREQDRMKGQKMEELAAEKRRLEDEVQVLRQQVTLGVRQVELIWSAKNERLMQEVDKTKKQLEYARELIDKSDLARLRCAAAQVEELEARERDRILAQKAEKRSQALESNLAYADFVSSLNQDVPAARGDAEHVMGFVPESSVIKQAGDKSDDESEDGDFVGGSSSGSSEEGSETDDSSDEIGPFAPQHSQVPVDLSGIQYPAIEASELVNAALASTEGILPGGLASISPAPVDGAPFYTAQSMDTSGETTELTTSASIAAPTASAAERGDTQQDTSSGALFAESDEILELDSGILESQFAYPCSWGKSAGSECRKLFVSQRELYDHVVDEHATAQ